MRNLILFAILIFGCAPKQSVSENQKAEVMKIHDDAMEKMGEVRQLAFELEELAVNHPDSIVIRQVIVALEDADEGMMVWMSEYKEPDQENLDEFFKSEKKKIEEVANNIYKSIENGHKYIDK